MRNNTRHIQTLMHAAAILIVGLVSVAVVLIVGGHIVTGLVEGWESKFDGRNTHDTDYIH